MGTQPPGEFDVKTIKDALDISNSVWKESIAPALREPDHPLTKSLAAMRFLRRERQRTRRSEPACQAVRRAELLPMDWKIRKRRKHEVKKRASTPDHMHSYCCVVGCPNPARAGTADGLIDASADSITNTISDTVAPTRPPIRPTDRASSRDCDEVASGKC